MCALWNHERVALLQERGGLRSLGFWLLHQVLALDVYTLFALPLHAGTVFPPDCTPLRLGFKVDLALRACRNRRCAIADSGSMSALPTPIRRAPSRASALTLIRKHFHLVCFFCLSRCKKRSIPYASSVQTGSFISF